MNQINQESNAINFHHLLELSGIQQNMTVADLGCGGHGKLTFLLSKLVGTHGLVYAIDVIKEHLQIIEKKAKADNIRNIRTIWSDLEIFSGTKIETNSLDFAVLSFVLHQSEKHVDLMREVFRMLKKNGRLLILEWNKLSSLSGPSLERRLSSSQIEGMASKIGFKTEKELVVNQHHFGLILNK